MQAGRSASGARPLNQSLFTWPWLRAGEGDLCREALGIGGTSVHSPGRLVCTRRLSAPHRGPLSASGVAAGPSLSGQGLLGGARLSSQSTHSLGVWSDATGLASCHLFPGLLQTGQVQRCCLAGAAFLETTGKWREAGCGVPSTGTGATVGSGYTPRRQPTLWHACSLVLLGPV